MKARDLRAVLSCLLAVVSAAVFAAEKPAAQSLPSPVYGWVDMPTHPMSHLAFGGKLVHGSPDLGIVVPAIPTVAVADRRSTADSLLNARHFEARSTQRREQ